MRRQAYLATGFALVAVANARMVCAQAEASAANNAASASSSSQRSDPLQSQLAAHTAAIAELRTAVAEEKQRVDQPRLQISGYAQVDWVVHSQASFDEVDHARDRPLNQDRFTLRRAHLRFQGEDGLVTAVMEMDANTIDGPQLRPIDAELSLRWPAKAGNFSIAAAIGLMKIPFGFEIPEADAARPFLERSTVMRALFPGQYDLGARVLGRYRFAEWAIALMNGNPIGDKAFPALAPVHRKDLVGRLGIHAEIVPGLHLDLGISAETGLGLHEGTQTTKDQLVWRDENGDGVVQATEVQVIPGSSATASQTFARFAIGADARIAIDIDPLGGLTVRSEIVRAQNLDRGVEYADPVGAGYDLRERGFTLGATQELTRWAMIGARYDRYNPDHDANERRSINLVPVDRSYSTWALMAMLRYRKTRLLVEYDKNGNTLGRAADGTPTTLQSDAVTLRAQAVF